MAKPITGIGCAAPFGGAVTTDGRWTYRFAGIGVTADGEQTRMRVRHYPFKPALAWPPDEYWARECAGVGGDPPTARSLDYRASLFAAAAAMLWRRRPDRMRRSASLMLLDASSVLAGPLAFSGLLPLAIVAAARPGALRR